MRESSPRASGSRPALQDVSACPIGTHTRVAIRVLMMAALFGIAPVATVAAQASGTASAQERSRTGQGTPAERAALERRLRDGYLRVLQRELRLTADQSQRLEAMTGRMEEQRRPLHMRERAVREQLRAQLEGATPDEARVTSLIDELLRLQRQRLDLLEVEQRELAGFLTPVQRARYLALQENFRRRLEEQRGRERTSGTPSAPRGRRPPG